MTVVFKLGGSLLTLPGLAAKLRAVVAQRIGENCLFVVGGGATADAVREWSRVHQLDDEASHWLAIASLDLNRCLIANLLGWRTARSRSEAELLWSADPSPILLEVAEFLRSEEADDESRLPHNWDVTSDSIAAWTSLRWPATELVLLKSVQYPHSLNCIEASNNSVVDRYFPYIVDRINHISWVNLRSNQLEIQSWLHVNS